MKEEIITFSTAVLARTKGFKSKSGYYEGNGILAEVPNVPENDYRHTNNAMQRFRYEAPSQTLLQRWLREKHFIDVFVIDSIKENHYDWEIRLEDDEPKIECDQYYLHYELALEDGLQKALNII
jgi:hypothetical protein